MSSERPEFSYEVVDGYFLLAMRLPRTRCDVCQRTYMHEPAPYQRIDADAIGRGISFYRPDSDNWVWLEGPRVPVKGDGYPDRDGKRPLRAIACPGCAESIQAARRLDEEKSSHEDAAREVLAAKVTTWR